MANAAVKRNGDAVRVKEYAVFVLIKLRASTTKIHKNCVNILLREAKFCPVESQAIALNTRGKSRLPLNGLAASRCCPT